MEEASPIFPETEAEETMKIQVDDGIIEVVRLPKGDIRLTVGEPGRVMGSVSMTPQDTQVVIAALEAAKDDF